jgi:16S rRNA (cytidine1402-2'-O)-methyltransferase
MLDNSESSLEAGVLYVVATPIGHLDDISRRAVDVLSAVEMIAAEDTRRTLSLLRAYAVKAPKLVALHEHNELALAAELVRQLQAGASAALVSDAGTPLLSDPGYHLVRSCYEGGVPVRPVPGPSAVMAAMSVCPLPLSGCRFEGFLPSRAGARKAALTSLVESGQPIVFFEAPHRLRDCLQALDALAPERRVFVAREMTKRFETYLVGPPAELIARMDAAEQWRGEVVCILEGVLDQAASAAEQQRVMRILAAELAPAQAARIGAQILGVKKKDLYRLASQGEPEAEPPAG